MKLNPFSSSGCSSHHMEPTGHIERIEVHKDHAIVGGGTFYYSVVRVERTRCAHEGCHETVETERRFTVNEDDFGHDFLAAIEADDYHPDGEGDDE